MATLNVFAKRMRDRADEIAKNVNQTVIETALIVDAKVILSTPVDTGRARANWRAEIGGPFTSEVDSTSASEAISQGRQTIGARRPGQTIYISNNVPYIKRLNEGSSKQAPAGFVEAAAKAGSDYFNRAAKAFD